jgi:hypothetical protein
LVSCAANAADLTAEPTRVLGIRVRGGHGISLTHYVHVLSGVVNVDARPRRSSLIRAFESRAE